MDEEILAGGNSTVVVRVGDTVRRTAGPWTGSVRRLLTELRLAGVSEVPAHLGLDEQGREVVEFLPGEVAGYPLPDWLWDPALVQQAGSLLRRLHDASAPLARQPGPWQLPAHEPREVVCHNDVAPYNMVFRDGRLVGLIDFDTASPGPRIWDLAYLAYRLCPFGDDAGKAAPRGRDRQRRLDQLIEAYGWDFDPAQMLRVAATRLEELAAWTDQRAVQTGRPDFRDHAALYRRDRLRLLDLAPAPG